jgi:hypothetical protein
MLPREQKESTSGEGGADKLGVTLECFARQLRRVGFRHTFV